MSFDLLKRRSRVSCIVLLRQLCCSPWHSFRVRIRLKATWHHNAETHLNPHTWQLNHTVVHRWYIGIINSCWLMPWVGDYNTKKNEYSYGVWVYRGNDVQHLIVTLGATTSDACVGILSKLETRTDSQLEIKMYLLKGQLTPKCKRSDTLALLI